MRRALVPVVASAIVLLGAAQAAPPDYPVNFIEVDELKAKLDAGAKADVIDVRHWPDYEAMHIKGARSMPLRAITERAGEISKTGLVVFY
jgi:hypothetical protein